MSIINSLSSGQTSSMMAFTVPADYNVFSLVRIEDPKSAPKDKKLIQYVEDKIQMPFIATAESDLSLYVMMQLEQDLGKNIYWVTGPTFEQVIKQAAGILPNRRARFCTTEMKMIPIFWWCYLYLFNGVDDSVTMNIGYRADEPNRKTNDIIEIPFSCNNYGQNRQNLTEIDWRTCQTPLRKMGIVKRNVIDFFKTKPQYKFPKFSNCAGCFNKSELELQEQFELEPSKMDWFSKQEIGKMRWNMYRTLEEIRTTDYYGGQQPLFGEFTTCDCHD